MGAEIVDNFAEERKQSGVLPNTLSASFPSVPSGFALLRGCGWKVEASTAAACHSEAGAKAVASPILVASGVAVNLAQRTVRFSVGRTTTRAEVERAAKMIAAGVRKS